MASIQGFVTNIGTALTALAPAIGPLVTAFAKLMEVGSGFLPGISDTIVSLAEAFAQWIASAAESGQLQAWMQGALDMLGALAPIIPSVVSAFMSMVPVAERLAGPFTNLVVAGGALFEKLVPLLGHIGSMETIMSGMATACGIAVTAINAVGSAFDWVKQSLLAHGNT